MAQLAGMVSAKPLLPALMGQLAGTLSAKPFVPALIVQFANTLSAKPFVPAPKAQLAPREFLVKPRVPRVKLGIPPSEGDRRCDRFRCSS